MIIEGPQRGEHSASQDQVIEKNMSDEVGRPVNNAVTTVEDRVLDRAST